MNDPTAARVHIEVAKLLQMKDSLQQQLAGIDNQLLVLGRVLEQEKPAAVPEPVPKPGAKSKSVKRPNPPLDTIAKK